MPCCPTYAIGRRFPKVLAAGREGLPRSMVPRWQLIEQQSSVIEYNLDEYNPVGPLVVGANKDWNYGAFFNFVLPLLLIFAFGQEQQQKQLTIIWPAVVVKKMQQQQQLGDLVDSKAISTGHKWPRELRLGELRP